MKTIKQGSEIKRVQDKEAYQLVKSGWSFCPKKEWKNRKIHKQMGNTPNAVETDNAIKKAVIKERPSKKQSKKDKDVADTLKATK